MKITMRVMSKGFFPPLGWKRHLLCFPTAPWVTWVDIAENLLSQRKSKRDTVMTGLYLTFTRQVREKPESISCLCKELYTSATYRRKSYFTWIYTLRNRMKIILFKHSWRVNIPQEHWRQKSSSWEAGSPLLAHLKLCVEPPPRPMGCWGWSALSMWLLLVGTA